MRSAVLVLREELGGLDLERVGKPFDRALLRVPSARFQLVRNRPDGAEGSLRPFSLSLFANLS
jgi:hypothetical protein